jgi:hypothetical protein
MPAILMLGSLLDPHIQRIFDELRSRGQLQVEVLDFRSTIFEATFESDGSFSLAIDGRQLPEDLTIFDRAVLVAGSAFYPVGEESAMGFGAEEWRALYRLLAALYGDRVLNSLRSRECLAKPFQQIVAVKSGMKVPRTLVTNERAASLRFADGAPGHLVMKSLSGMKPRPAYERDIIPYSVMTMRVNKSDIEGATDGELAFCPHFLQHEIRKQFELRVVWVDGVARAFKVDSQQLKCSETDWRWAGRELPFEPFELNDEVGRAIGRFMKSMGFFSGSVDLIIDVEGDPWFLECNNQGAWAWLDNIVDGALTRLFADRIMARALQGSGKWTCVKSECGCWLRLRQLVQNGSTDSHDSIIKRGG